MTSATLGWTLLAVQLGGGGAPITASSDWITTGTDCALFACGDVDGDGFGDVATINGARELCVAYTVRGWKASPWVVLHKEIAADAVGLGFARSHNPPYFDLIVARPKELDRWLAKPTGLEAPRINPIHDYVIAGAFGQSGVFWLRDTRGEHFMLRPLAEKFDGPRKGPVRRSPLPVTPPSYGFQGDEQPLFRFSGDIDGDAVIDEFAVFAATQPHPHHVVRVAVAPNGLSGDLDTDGLTDAAEKERGSDPLDRDTDDDGLLDGWEVNGLPRGLPPLGLKLDPRRQDVIVQVSPWAGMDRAAVEAECARSARPYAELQTKNHDGSSGVQLHFVCLPDVPTAEQGNWWDVGARVFEPHRRGLMHWMQVTPGGGGQSQQLGDLGSCGNSWHAFAHELGHQLGLSHSGDSAPAWCPTYPSLMNYAFNYSFEGDAQKVRFSDGSLRALELNESALSERVPLALAQLAYLAQPPFSFTLQALDDAHTWIDWDHDGMRDEALVSADINYGGSTSAGIRRDVAKARSGPVLARIGESIWLFYLDDAGKLLARKHEGGESWSADVTLAAEAGITEFAVAGGQSRAALAWRSERTNGPAWTIAACDGKQLLDAWPQFDTLERELSGGEIDSESVLASRARDGAVQLHALAERRLERPEDSGFDASGKWDVALDFTSDVPIGFAQDPRTKSLVVAGAGTKSGDRKFNLKVAWFDAESDGSWKKREERWVGGEQGLVHCTTRPTVRFTPAGQLVIFHTGWADANGLMTGWRATPVANKALNDGWLVCQMYDVWTQTRVPVGFEIAGDTAIYAYRWDPPGERERILQVAHAGLGLDPEPMRDFDDAALISQWGIKHSILLMRR